MPDEPLTWFDRDAFRLGALYVCDQADATLEYVGYVTAAVAKQLVSMPEVVEVDTPLEPVMLFTQIDAPEAGFWTHTRLDSLDGIALRAVADRGSDEAAADDE